MSTHTSQGVAEGFTAALLIPALASTLRQAQREAASDLHLLADYYRRALSSGNAPLPLRQGERRAAIQLGRILVEQGINGTAFFLMVKVAVAAAGPLGGMLAQVGITTNTIVTPQQTQKLNPARTLFGRLGTTPDWCQYLSEPSLQTFAFYSGKFAHWCDYGTRDIPIPPPASDMQISWSLRPANQRPSVHSYL